MDVTGSRVTGSMWMLQGLCDSYGIYMAVTGSMSQLWDLHVCGCYRVYVTVMGSTCMWLLQGLCDSYGIYVAVMGSM